MECKKMSKRYVFLMFLGIIGSVVMAAPAQAGHAVLDAPENWRLAVQAWTFHKATFCEAVDNAVLMGLSYIEAFPGQSFSKEKPDAPFGHMATPEIRQAAREKLAAAGITLTSYGVVGLPNDEVECRKVFDFAKEMGIETISSEPPVEAFDLVDRLCNEYEINVALHNHPKPSGYWNPEKVLEVCQGRSKRIGACADTGHWMRSGVNPVEALKKLSGRIISLHFKDVNEFNQMDAHDVIWGTGKNDVKAMLAELDRQNFKGVFTIEYEYNWDNSIPDIIQCIRYFDQESAKLGYPTWRWLFNGMDLTGWAANPDSWVVEEGGLLSPRGGGDIWTNERFGNFILDLEFKLSKDANSGVFLRCADLNDWINTTIEVQIHETGDGTPHGQCGAIYDCLSPSANAVKPAGQWNRYTITCRDNKIHVVLNGVPVIDMDLNQWTQAGKNPDGSPNKFTIAYKDMARDGLIGLQYHGHPIWFRNIRIKQLEQ